MPVLHIIDLYFKRTSMFPFPEQLSAAGKAVLESQLTSAHAFAQAVFDSSKTALDLHVAAVKTSLEAASAAGSQLILAKTPQEFVSLSTTYSQQAVERARDYGQQATELAQGTRAKLTEVAETEIANSKQKVGDLVDAVKQAPSDTNAPLNSLFKGAFERAQAGYDQLAQAGKQVQAQVTEASAAAARGFQSAA